jgi:hypothetical protein
MQRSTHGTMRASSVGMSSGRPWGSREAWYAMSRAVYVWQRAFWRNVMPVPAGTHLRQRRQRLGQCHMSAMVRPVSPRHALRDVGACVTTSSVTRHAGLYGTEFARGDPVCKSRPTILHHPPARTDVTSCPNSPVRPWGSHAGWHVSNLIGAAPLLAPHIVHCHCQLMLCPLQGEP